MSIRPIDLNGMIQNTQEVAQNRATQEGRPMVQQEFTAIETENEVRLSAEQVNEYDNAAESDMDASHGNGTGYQRQKGSGKKKKKKVVSDGAVRLKNQREAFDVKV